MRIAVIVYGRLNHCSITYDKIMDSLGKENDIDFFLSSDNSSESLLNEFCLLYKPVLYNNNPVYYDTDLSIYPGKYEVTNLHNMTCHFINKNRVFVLLEDYINKNNINYDVVVCLRIDCIINNKFTFNNLEDNTIYIPSGYDYVDNAINDQIAYGKVDVMKKYNSLNPKELLEKKLSILHPESLNLANIRYYNLRVVRTELNYYLCR